MMILTRTGAEIEIAYASGQRLAIAVDRLHCAALSTGRAADGRVRTALVLDYAGAGSETIEGSLATLCAIQERIGEVMSETALAAEATKPARGEDEVTEDNWYYGAASSP